MLSGAWFTDRCSVEHSAQEGAETAHCAERYWVQHNAQADGQWGTVHRQWSTVHRPDAQAAKCRCLAEHSAQAASS